MPPSTPNQLLDQVARLIGNAFTSIGNLLLLMFVGFLRISPLPDQVDFLLVCMVIIWLISLLVRMIRGK